MKTATEQAFGNISNEFAIPDKARPGEWKCRLCGGESSPPNLPIAHTPTCDLTVVYQALEGEE